MFSRPWIVTALALAACTAPASRESATRSLADADGVALSLDRPAARIVSLVPSATETIIALGSTAQLVARTRYDSLAAIKALPDVGGGLDPSAEVIVALKPDVVISYNGPQNDRLRRDLQSAGIPAFSIRTDDTTDVFNSITNLGTITGRDSAATALKTKLRTELAAIGASVASLPRPSVFYVVWNNPPMTAGPNTFIGQILSVAGGRSVFDDVKDNWPTVGLEDVVKRQPDIIVLPSGEMRADRTDVLRQTPGWRDLNAVKKDRILRVPSDLVNRPGPGMADAARVLRDGIHPEAAAPK